jgi:hypothetical protein
VAGVSTHLLHRSPKAPIIGPGVLIGRATPAFTRFLLAVRARTSTASVPHFPEKNKNESPALQSGIFYGEHMEYERLSKPRFSAKDKEFLVEHQFPPVNLPKWLALAVFGLFIVVIFVALQG